MTLAFAPADVIGADLASNVEIAPDGCWNWTAVRNPEGYGRVHLGSRRYVGAHRLTYRAAKGEIPDGLEIDHLCRNPSCVNPDHLEAVTHAENIRRGNEHGRKRPEPRTHCRRGHELTPENLLTSKQGKRQCRVCKNAGRRKWDQDKRDAARALTVGVHAVDDETDDEDTRDAKTRAAGD